MNHLQKVVRLRNHWFAFRHGKSKAQEREIIVSSLEKGLKEENGLCADGRQEVRGSISWGKDVQILGSATIIASSPFFRARESAEMAHQLLGCEHPILYDLRLIERFFGTFEGGPNSNYPTAWEHDKEDSARVKWGVESADGVQERGTHFVEQVDRLFEDKKIVIFSHGDLLQILQTGFTKISAAFHRKMPHLKTGELRELVLVH